MSPKAFRSRTPYNRPRLVSVASTCTATEPLVVTFGIDEFWRRVDPTGRIIGDDGFHSWPKITDRPCFSWLQMLGCLKIFYWYDVAWQDGYPFGGVPMSGAHRSVTLGREDSLPDEPAASMAKLAR
jgi:hypothetical protein